MTTIGFHYFPDDTHYRTSDLQAWLPELKALGARWLTLVGSLTRAVPEAFIQPLRDAGIEPIIHLPLVPIRPIPPAELETLFQSYARWGVKYVALFSEPNVRSAWSPADWGKPALVERFLELLLPVLEAQVEAGLTPVFPALRAGGDYWDTGFLEAALAGMNRRGADAITKQLVFAVNLWTYNRPLGWGQGGLQRWPEAKPYLTPSGTQDQQGFHLVDWYDEIIRSRLGESHPFLCLSGGPRIGDQTDKSFLPVDELWHESCIREIMQAQARQELLPNLLNINYWLLAAAEGSPFANEAWYRTNGATLPAVDMLKQRVQVQNKATKVFVPAVPADGTPEAPADNGAAKPIQHYLLLPAFEWGISEWHWSAAIDYVKAFRPTCGFSPQEAAQAHRVTIVGNEQGVSRDIENMLRLAGCAVERVAGRDGQETAALLKTIAQQVAPKP
jgi:hypothetical protein